MQINGINQVGNTPEPKKGNKAENKPVIEQKTAPASAQDAAAGYGRAMLYIPKISFGQARHETKIPIGLIDYAQAEKVGFDHDVVKLNERDFVDLTEIRDAEQHYGQKFILSFAEAQENGHNPIKVADDIWLDTKAMLIAKSKEENPIPIGLIDYEQATKIGFDHNVVKLNDRDFVDLTVIKDAETEHGQKFILPYREVEVVTNEGHVTVKVTNDEWLDVTAMHEALKKK